MFTENFAPFFNTADFATTATVTIGTSTSSVPVIFDAAYFDPLAQFEGSAPVAWCEAAQVPLIAHGDTLTVGTTTYNVVEIQPDGTGVVLLRLRT